MGIVAHYKKYEQSNLPFRVIFEMFFKRMSWNEAQLLQNLQQFKKKETAG